MSQWQYLTQNLPPMPWVIGSVIILLITLLAIVYVSDTSKEYPHSSDPNFGKRLFWGRIGTALFWGYAIFLESWPVLLGAVVVVALMRCS